MSSEEETKPKAIEIFLPVFRTSIGGMNTAVAIELEDVFVSSIEVFPPELIRAGHHT